MCPPRRLSRTSTENSPTARVEQGRQLPQRPHHGAHAVCCRVQHSYQAPRDTPLETACRQLSRDHAAELRTVLAKLQTSSHHSSKLYWRMSLSSHNTANVDRFRQMPPQLASICYCFIHAIRSLTALCIIAMFMYAYILIRCSSGMACAKYQVNYSTCQPVKLRTSRWIYSR